MKRRRAVLPALLAVVVMLVAVAASAQIAPVAQVPLKVNKIPQFVQPLPLLELAPTAGSGIPVITAPIYELSMCEFKTSILPAGSLGKNTPAPATWVWGYREGAACPDAAGGGPLLVEDSYIGPVVVAAKGTPTEVTYWNKLGDSSTTNVLAYQQSTDQTLMWADPLNEYLNPVNEFVGPSEGNPCAEKLVAGDPLGTYCLLNYAGPIPAAPHLHGGEIPAGVDGGPDAWWTKDGLYGHGYYSTGGVGDAAAGKATYEYTNTQEPAPIWFHDHVLGATRLNVYAGIAGAYYIVDPQEGNPNYPADPTLPDVTKVVPIVIQDRMFDTTGQLLFPAAGINPEHPFWIPEFVGDVIVVNGKAWPFLDVEPRKYRFLFLNGSNARAYELFLIDKATGVKGPSLFVIGTDQGYLDNAVEINPNVKPNDKLTIMPGERYEVVIDFGAFAPGTTLRLENTAKTPYPDGAPVSGRTTGRIMEFRVTCPPAGCPVDPSIWVAANGTPVRVADFINRFVTPAGAQETAVPVLKTRRLTLNEAMGPGGPLEVLVNNTRYRGDVAFVTGDLARPDFSPITTQWNTTFYSEIPYEGETEIWEIVNLTADAHPIHPHLVAFQLLNREAFDVRNYDAAYNLAFPGGGWDPVALAPYLPGFYMPGFGPPLDYGCGTNPTPPGPGVPMPITNPDGTTMPCVLGGNPDPTPFLSGVKIPPLPSEYGWKDTVIAYPGQVTRFLVRFAPTHFEAGTPAQDAFYDFNPNGGHGYVWHCHIIDHEDNEMMRPMSVVENLAAPGDRFQLPQAYPENPLP